MRQQVLIIFFQSKLEAHVFEQIKMAKTQEAVQVLDGLSRFIYTDYSASNRSWDTLKTPPTLFRKMLVSKLPVALT